MFKVKVSPFLSVSEWVDPHSGLTFSKSAGIIEIPDGTDLTGIKKHIRLNQLIFCGGDIKQYREVKRVIPIPAVKDTVDAIDEKPLEKMTVNELKEKAKELGIPGYTGMKKAELLKTINNV